MLKVGVTGGIGSGKSLVCSVISAMGFPIYNSDNEAKKIVDNNIDVISSIKKLFSNDIYVDGRLARKKVAELVFSDRNLLIKLNEIVHPAVENHFREWVKSNLHHKLIIQEAAIIFESGANKYLDKVVGVTAPLETKIDRIIKRDGVDKESVLNRIKSQMSDDELIKKCDFIIYNDGKQHIVPQVNKIVETLLTEIER